jgi:hypothetical protein
MTRAIEQTKQVSPDREIDRGVADHVLMYPGNQLMDQVRPFEETSSIFEVVRDRFFARKDD